MRYFLVLIFLSIASIIYSANTDTTKIIFLHPTVQNIETFIYLNENKLIDIKNVKFIGVYYEKEEYDYKRSISYLKDTNINYISLHKLSGKIEQDEIFKINSLTNSFDSLFSISNGIVFMGGDDISPVVYSDRMKLLTKVTDPYRHFFEISFMNHLIGGKKPFLKDNKKYVVLGICLGMQTMNVAMGGSLYQDIPSEIYGNTYVEEVIAKPELMHKNYYKKLMHNDTLMGAKLHKIKAVDSKNKIYSVLDANKTPIVLSWHHQAVKKLGKNLEIIFNSEDGKVVEGIAHKKFANVYGFQFHPEYTKLYRDDVSYRELPESDIKTIKFILIERNSMQFHKGLWSYFSNMFVQ